MPAMASQSASAPTATPNAAAPAAQGGGAAQIQQTAAQRAASTLFLEGQGWGYGGSVDVERNAPWTVPGRYGWVGGLGSAAHIDPVRRGITIVLTTVAMTSPVPPTVMRDFWTYAAGR